MRTATVTLNGQEFTIQEKCRGENKAWRDKLAAHFAEVTGLADADIDSAAGLGHIVQVVASKLVRSVDLVVDLVTDYAPDLPLDDAYESEIVDVFWAILGLAYPFGFERLLERILGLVQSGQELRSTKPSSPSASGDDQTTSSIG